MDDKGAPIRDLLARARRAADPPHAVAMRVQARLLAQIGPPAIGLGASTASFVGALKLGTLAAVTLAIGLHLLVGPEHAGDVPTGIDAPAVIDAPSSIEPPSPKPSSRPPVVSSPRATTPSVRTTSDDSVPVADAPRRSDRSYADGRKLAAELASLAAVNDALAGGDVRSAAARLRRHRRHFADGQMRSEALVLEILVAAASDAPVTVTCDRFAAVHPESVHDRRIAAICR